MNIRLLKPEDEEILEEFVGKHPHGFIEQTWAWGVLQTTIPGRSDFYALGVFKNDQLLASMLVIRQHMGYGKTWLWCPRGPILPKKEAMAAWQLMKEKVDEIARENKDVYLRIEPGVPSDEEFIAKGKSSKENYLPEHTLMIDLTLSEENILKQMTQKGRYNIRKAEKAGVYVKRSDFKDFDDFYDLLKVTAQRDHFQIHDRDFYTSFFDFLEEKAQFYLAFMDHDLLGGLMVTHFGKTATYYFGASSNEHRRAMAPYALQWFAMHEAKKAGMKQYDFLGVAPPGDDRHVLAGVTQFKTRFGGQRVHYHPAQVFVYRPFWWRVVSLAKGFV